MYYFVRFTAFCSIVKACCRALSLMIFMEKGRSRRITLCFVLFLFAFYFYFLEL